MRARSSTVVAVRTNLATNPDAETAGAPATVRTNWCANPSFEVGTTGWAVTGTGATAARLTTGGASGAAFVRLTTGAPETASAYVSTSYPVTAGEAFAFSASVRGTPAAVTVSLRATWGGGPASTRGVGALLESATDWQTITYTGTVPTGATTVRLDVYALNLPGTSAATVDVDAVLAERLTSVVLPYFDGSLPAAADFTYAWSGTAHASPSYQLAPAIVGSSPFNGNLSARWSTTAEHDTGARSLACLPRQAVSNVGHIWAVTPLLAGQVITVRARVMSAAGRRLALSARTSNGGAFGLVIVDGTGAWQDVTCTATATADGHLIGFQVFNASPLVAGVPFYVDRVIAVVDTAPYTGPYFDGDTPDVPGTVYAWTGPAHASTSTMSTTIEVPDPGRVAVAASHILSCEALLYAEQPDGPDDPTGRVLSLRGGTFVDDVARGYARTYALQVTDPVADIAPGQWVRVRAGISGDPAPYLLPALMVSSAASSTSGTLISATDIGTCLDEVVFERDRTLTGTLRTLAAELTTGVPTLTRPVDVSQVPALAIPGNTVAEFGHGRWDVLLGVAESLGVDLLWTDDGDLRGIARTTSPPTPAARVDSILVNGGQAERNRPVTRAVVLVARDKGMTELVGTAPTGPAPAGVTVSDRLDGDATTTQAQADALAAGLLARRTSERNVRDVDTAPLPWIEAGTDTVELDGDTWWVRALTLQLPSLATALTLRDAS